MSARARHSGNPPRVFRPQKVVAKLQRETRPAFVERGMIVREPQDIAYALADYMGDRAHELFVVLFVNIRNQIVGYTEYSSGGIAEVEVNVSGLMREALASGAAAMVTIHQHPTGVAEPSDADLALWKRLREVGKLVGVPVLDNMILGEGEYFSEMQEGRGSIPDELRPRGRRAAER